MSVTHLQVVGSEPTLVELANTVRREDQLASQAGVALVEHAVNAGKALIEAKRLVPHGEWEEWLKEQFPDRHTKTLRLYARLARHEDVLIAKRPSTITAAQRLIAGETLRPPGHELRDEAKKLAKQKVPQREIADRLGVSPTTIGAWLNPAIAERRRQRLRQESRFARRARHRAERDAAVKRVGGDVAEAYTFVRRAALALEEAGCDAPNREVKGHLDAALGGLYRVEDEIVRASRLS